MRNIVLFILLMEPIKWISALYLSAIIKLPLQIFT